MNVLSAALVVSTKRRETEQEKIIDDLLVAIVSVPFQYCRIQIRIVWAVRIVQVATRNI